jgi:succinate-semialdehyde dehydrogenase/glutarate-semialdehyde dehydrogenase
MNARPADTDVRDREIVSINPATLEELGRFPVSSAAEVNAAVARARAAQPAWAALSFRNRARYILKARRALYDRQNEIIQLISDETGKPAFEALSTEVFPVADLMSHFAARTERILKDEKFTLAVFRNKRSAIIHEPLGVVGIISPWNFPFAIPMGEIVMALMAGNAVVLKPSEHTPLVADGIRRLMASVDFPEGVLEVVQGDGSAGAALVDSPIDKIFFTGSVRTGKRIAETAAKRLLPVTLELGGKDAMIVLEDAPFERTVRGAVWGAMANCGQVCASVERLYVVESMADRFIPAVVSEVKKLRLGPPSSECNADIGPLVNENQLNTVSEHVADAVARGARVLAGGRRREDLGGYFFEPTVLVDVDDSMKVMTEETFGPVLPIRIVKDEEEAIREANNSRYGLLASVWTTNERGRKLARRIEAGTVIINDAVYTHGAAQTPWFGVKESGLGVTHGSAGLLEFVRMKHINWDLMPMKSDWWWFPYTERWQRRFKTLMKVLYRWGWRKIA